MKNRLKTGILLLFIVTQLTAQDTIERQLRTVDFEEWNHKYSTVDEKGKLLHAVHISELTVNSKWCLNVPVRIAFNSSEGRILKDAGWYEWNPVRRCWMRIAVPNYSAHRDKAPGGEYIIDVNCPGVYGLFFLSSPSSAGVSFKAPGLHRIRQLKIVQERPGLSIVYCPERSSRSVFVPTKALTYSTQVSAEIESPKGDIYSVQATCLGGLMDMDELKAKNKSPVVYIGRGKASRLPTDTKAVQSTESVLTIHH